MLYHYLYAFYWTYCHYILSEYPLNSIKLLAGNNLDKSELHFQKKHEIIMDRRDRKINFNYWIIMLNYRNGFVMIAKREFVADRTGYWARLLIINVFECVVIQCILNHATLPVLPLSLQMEIDSRHLSPTQSINTTGWFVADWAITITTTTTTTTWKYDISC